MNAFRCSVCGRWSHAQKRPRYHLRTMSSREDMPDAGGLPIVEERVEPIYEWFNPCEPEPGGGWAHLDDAYCLTVRCGPFDTYELIRQGGAVKESMTPDDIMTAHSEAADGRCILCRVVWPCGPWVDAREAYDHIDNPEDKDDDS